MKRTVVCIGVCFFALLTLVAGCSASTEGSEDLGASTAAVSGSSSGGPACWADDFDGRATALGVHVGIATVGATLVISDTGPLPPTGGSKKALLDLYSTNLVGTGVLTAQTWSNDTSVVSTASVDKLAVHLPGLEIAADVLSSNATATCGACGPTLDAGADIANLTINGATIPISGKPNQVINLGLARIVINEITQATRSSGESDIHVDALHVTVLNVADVVISSAWAGVTCGYNAENPTNPACQPSTSCCQATCYNGEPLPCGGS